VFDHYSSLKPAWHLDRIADLRNGKDIVPTHLQLVISDLCNQDCHFCAYRMEGGFATEQFPDEKGNKNPKRFIPTEKVKEILEDASEVGVRAIQFTGGGEPTVHPDWLELIGYAQTLGFQTGLVTNGIRLKAHPVLEKLTWMRISLDAGRQVTYEAVRNHKGWNKALQALELAGSLKGPLVGAGFVVTLDNYHEIAECAHLVKKFKMSYLRISAMFSDKGASYYNGLENWIEGERAGAKALEDETFHVVDFFENRLQDLEMAAPNYDFCGMQQFVLYIGGDQKVYTCCTNAYTKHGEIGDLTEQSFARWLMDSKRFNFNARSCHHCQFNDKNQVINYLLSDPAHVDFV
jgi:MoaA/NifB/PqqE/SkfB family radical SAM enzyme